MTQPIAAFHVHGTSDFVIPRADPLVVALETLPLGDPFAEAIAAAFAAAEALYRAALAEVFPAKLTPSTADAIAEYTWRTGRLVSVGYDEQVADLHLRALAAHPELARLLRSHDTIADVETAAANWAVPTDHLDPIGAAKARAATEARRRYQITIARQIAAVPEHELAPAAKRLLAADALLARVAAERARREDHAKAELARVQAEQRAAARLVADGVVARVREAARVAEDARVRALQAAEQYRHTRADGLIERLRTHGLRELRVGSGEAERVYEVDNLIKTAHAMSPETLAFFDAALARHEAA